MIFHKRWVVGWLVMIVFQNTPLADAHERSAFVPQPEIVWKSERLFASWFRGTYGVRIGDDGVPADWVVVKAGKRSDLKIEVITVKYLSRHHRHAHKKKFYPYERIRNGDRVRFKLHGVQRVIGVKVRASGWSGSRSTDGFRIILKKNTNHPPRGWMQTGYFYGQCIGGRNCPGYRRMPINNFSVDLGDVMNIKKIQFFSHDRVGRSHNAKVNVYVDDQRVAQKIDIKFRGSQHTIELDPIFGRYITFEAATNDEAVIQRISVDYSTSWKKNRRGRTGPRHFPRGRLKR